MVLTYPFSPMPLSLFFYSVGMFSASSHLKIFRNLLLTLVSLSPPVIPWLTPTDSSALTLNVTSLGKLLDPQPPRLNQDPMLHKLIASSSFPLENLS